MIVNNGITLTGLKSIHVKPMKNLSTKKGSNDVCQAWSVERSSILNQGKVKHSLQTSTGLSRKSIKAILLEL